MSVSRIVRRRRLPSWPFALAVAAAEAKTRGGERKLRGLVREKGFDAEPTMTLIVKRARKTAPAQVSADELQGEAYGNRYAYLCEDFADLLIAV